MTDLDQLRLSIHDLTVGWEYRDPQTYKTTNHVGLWYLLRAQMQPVRMDDPRRGGKISGSPAPWASDVAGWLTDVAAGARDHELTLLRLLDRRVSERGGSDRNTVRALRLLPDLAEAVARTHPSSNVPRRVARDVHRWGRTARLLLGAERRWARVPLSCPVDDCGQETLRQRPADGAVVCSNCRAAWTEKELGWLGRLAGESA